MICLKCDILIIDTWNKYIKGNDGMVNLFFIVNLMLQKIPCQSFLFFSNLAWFSYYFPNNLSPIVCRKKSFVIHKISLFPNSSWNHTQLASKSKATIETVEKGVKYVQNLSWKHQNDIIDVVLVFLLSILNIFHTFFYYFYCWLWTSRC